MININLSVSTIITTIVVFINFIIAFYLLFNAHKHLVRYIFGYLVLMVGVWILLTYLVDNVTSDKYALIISRMVFIGPIFIPALLLHFSYLFPTAKKLNKINYYIIYAPLILLGLLIPTKFIVKNIIIQAWGTEFKYGELYILWVIYFVGFILFSLVKMVNNYRESSGIARIQIRYLFLGLSISSIIAIITNIILPIVGIQEFSIIGIQSIIIFLVFTAYAIIRYRLLDIRVIISRSIIYFFLILVVSALFVGLTSLTAYLFEEVLGANKIIFIMGTSTLIVIFLDPLKRWLSRSTDSVFFKAKIEYPVLLRDLSEIISTEIEIDALIENFTKKLDAGLKVKNSILVLQSKDGAFRVRTLGHPHTEPLVFEQNNPLIKYLNKEDKTIITEELQRKIEDTTEEKGKAELEKSIVELEKIQVSAIAPVKTKEKLNAVLLFGPKLSGDVINREEINLIEVLTPQIASAIEKSKLFEEVKGFSETLQKKVDDATGELSERNRFLLALQKVTNVITRSLDLNKAAQAIVDSIQKELGYIGGLLLLIDKEKDRIYPAAITQSKLTEKTLKLLPKPIYDYYSVYSQDNTLDTQAAKEQKIKIGKGFEDFVSPPIPKLVCQGIDKLLKVKSLVAVPIFAENEVIGIIDFILQKPKEEISEKEIDLMKSLADQTGIVYRNLKLFEQIKKANEELGEANVRLKALDQAKTEFVSIASHQLRTPMTGIMGYLSMLTSGDFGKLKEEHAKILKELLSESQRMIRLINQFLNVSKIEAGKFELSKREVSLEEVMQQKIKEISQAAEKKNLKLIYNPPKKKLPAVNADPDKLSDIILNLIDNAIKYTHKGSVTVSITQKDSEIQVAIKDTGVGINKQDAKELFGKFQRGTGIARIQPDGSGLGLFIAKSVVEGHKGRIWAESAGEGKGSTFYFTLPIKK